MECESKWDEERDKVEEAWHEEVNEEHGEENASSLLKASSWTTAESLDDGDAHRRIADERLDEDREAVEETGQATTKVGEGGGGGGRAAENVEENIRLSLSLIITWKEEGEEEETLS